MTPKQHTKADADLVESAGRRTATVPTEDRERWIASFVLEAASEACRLLERDPETLSDFSLARQAISAPLPDEGLSDEERAVVRRFVATPEFGTEHHISWEDEPMRLAHRVGHALDGIRALESRHSGSGDRASVRRSTGSYFTPGIVARSVVERSRELIEEQVESSPWSKTAPSFAVCDPAVGGGAFLLEAGRTLSQVLQSRGESAEQAKKAAVGCLFGVDRSALACATAEVALFLFCPEAFAKETTTPRFLVADTLWTNLLEEPGFPSSGFDWIVTNPPWVAYQGRAAQSLTPEERARFRNTFESFQGYPTLHGVFVERSTQLARGGVLSLLLPSSLSDLNGYRSTRAVLSRTHVPREPLLEYGQDAFSGVVQPCFALVAAPKRQAGLHADGEPWQLEERQRRSSVAETYSVPRVLVELAREPSLPDACFREMGFQSNRRVAQELFLQATEPKDPYVEPLLQGRNVREFHEAPPTLFLHPDPDVLTATRCRLRDEADYRRVTFVVRQTASYTIAAIHNGLRFRNSLIAGYARDDLDGPLLVGLLNSALYRAFHVSRQRDARQATFPQVKVAHLRALPAPPDHGETRETIRGLSLAARASGGLTVEDRSSLDEAVFDLFGLDASDRQRVLDFLAARTPKALAPSIS